MHDSITSAHRRIDGKVSWIVFALLVTVLLGTLGAQYAQTTDIKERVIVLQTEMRQMGGRDAQGAH